METAWRQQKQFVADASHELKTPLTVILTNTELLQSPDYDEAQKQQFTDGIRTMAQQMRALVERLLELARAENARPQAAFAPSASARSPRPPRCCLRPRSMSAG